MRKVLAFLLGVLSTAALAQVTSSSSLGCAVSASGVLACNGPSAVPETNKGQKKLPKLLVTRFTLEPGAILDQPSSSSDFLIIGINGGELVNEQQPFLHVSLEKDSVTLLPREQPFRLRNKSSQEVELRLVEIRR